MLARFTFENIIWCLGVIAFTLITLLLVVLCIYLLFGLFGYSFTETTKILSLQNED